MNDRYFIGITLPGNLSREIEQLQRDLFQPRKVMHPLKPHITLLHPDLLQTLPPDYFVQKIKEIADHSLPFEVKLTGINMFDKRVLYIGVSFENLMDFQEKLVNLLPEDIKARYLTSRPYKPHVTIVQSKPKQNLPQKLIGNFQNKVEPMLPAKFPVTHLAQFTWIRPRTYKIKKI